MKIRIDVQSKSEGEALKTAMADPATRAFVMVVGTMLPLGPRARKRVLEFVADKLDEDDQQRVRIETNETLNGDDPQKHHMQARIGSAAN